MLGFLDVVDAVFRLFFFLLFAEQREPVARHSEITLSVLSAG